MSQKYQLLAIGDVVTDAFIRLEESSAHIDIDKGNREICMSFAEKIPYKEVYVVPAVGNSANAAVCASRLGLKTAFVSNIGSDYFGKECLNTLKTEKVGTKFIKIHKNMKTNYHYVLWYDVDRTILIKHSGFDYKLPQLEKTSWVYLSSLSDNSLPYHTEITEYLKNNPETKLAFQPGTFQIKLGKEKLKGIYARTEIFFCNLEEAEIISEIQS